VVANDSEISSPAKFLKISDAAFPLNP